MDRFPWHDATEGSDAVMLCRCRSRVEVGSGGRTVDPTHPQAHDYRSRTELEAENQ